MSKPVKNMIAQNYHQRFGEQDGAVLVDICGVTANDVNRLRSELAEQDIRLTVVKNSLAKKVVQGTPMEGISQFLDGPSTMVYGGDTVVDVARVLVSVAKQIDHLEFKGALMEGQAFGPDRIEELSKYPTREEAQSQVLQLILSPGRNLAGSVLGPGGKIASLVKAIQEKLEEGETVSSAD